MQIRKHIEGSIVEVNSFFRTFFSIVHQGMYFDEFFFDIFQSSRVMNKYIHIYIPC